MFSLVSARRWAATRIMARLGVVAATLSGLALAFNIGGPSGYALPLSGTLGMPTLAILQSLGLLPPRVIVSPGHAAEWDLFHVVICVSIALNWTLVGVVVDLVRRPGIPQPAPVNIDPLDEPEEKLALDAGPDPLLDEFAQLERAARERAERSAVRREE